MRDLERSELAADFVKIIFRRRDIARIAGAEFDVIVLQQPPGQAAHVPFGAGIRSGPQDNPQTFLLGNATELGGIGLAAPIKDTFLRLDLVPKKISAHCVQAHGPRHLQALTPVFLGNTGGMDLAATDLQPLAIEQEVIGADDERMLGGLRVLRATFGNGIENERGQQEQACYEFHRGREMVFQDRVSGQR